MVSTAFWPWLDDDAFVAQLLEAAGLTANQKTGMLTVLAAAVDGVPRGTPKDDPFTSAEGFSILCGNSTELLPAAQRHATEREAKARVVRARTTGKGKPPPTPALEFRTPQARNGAFKSLTLPLANTLFTIGRPNPLVTSMWGPKDGRPLAKLFQNTVDTTQTVVLRKPGARPTASPPPVANGNLIALTKAHRILASFGNVLSKVWADGKQTPPSQELEAIIPRLLAARASALGDAGAQPADAVGVWALTIPERAVTILSQREDGLLKPLSLEPAPGRSRGPSRAGGYSRKAEHKLAEVSAESLSRIIAFGGRLSKVCKCLLPTLTPSPPTTAPPNNSPQ